MQQLLMSKVKELESGKDQDQLSKLNNLKSEALNQRYPKLKEWEEQLADPEFSISMEKKRELESLTAVLQNPEISKNKARLKQLENLNTKFTEVEELEYNSLLQFDSEIKRLENKVRDLNKYKELSKKYSRINTKFREAKKFSNSSFSNDPTFVKNGLRDFNVMNKFQKIVNGFENITLGNSFPYYSKLSLNSLSINGVHLQYNPGKFYIETNYGQSVRQAINNSFSLPQVTLPQTTLAIKAGIGPVQRNHLHFSFVK